MWYADIVTFNKVNSQIIFNLDAKAVRIKSDQPIFECTYLVSSWEMAVFVETSGYFEIHITSN